MSCNFLTDSHLSNWLDRSKIAGPEAFSCFEVCSQAPDTARGQLAEHEAPSQSEAPAKNLLPVQCERTEGVEDVNKVLVGDQPPMAGSEAPRAIPVLGADECFVQTSAVREDEVEEVEVGVQEFERGPEKEDAPVVATSAPDLWQDPVGALGSWWDSAVTAGLTLV